MDYNIVWVRGHVEVYDWAGRFCFSADNEREAREELALTALALKAPLGRDPFRGVCLRDIAPSFSLPISLK